MHVEGTLRSKEFVQEQVIPEVSAYCQRAWAMGRATREFTVAMTGGGRWFASSSYHLLRQRQAMSEVRLKGGRVIGYRGPESPGVA